MGSRDAREIVPVLLHDRENRHPAVDFYILTTTNTCNV